jgi:hypothetical protein
MENNKKEVTKEFKVRFNYYKNSPDPDLLEEVKNLESFKVIFRENIISKIKKIHDLMNNGEELFFTTLTINLERVLESKNIIWGIDRREVPFYNPKLIIICNRKCYISFENGLGEEGLLTSQFIDFNTFCLETFGWKV